MWSWHHRGTPSQPGLVLALDRQEGASCEGLALKVAPEHANEALAELRRRELVSFAYKEEIVTVETTDGGSLEAVTYIVDRENEQYCGNLSIEQQIETITTAVGGRGPNSEYLAKTVEAFRQLGIDDAILERIGADVKAVLKSQSRETSNVDPSAPSTRTMSPGRATS